MTIRQLPILILLISLLSTVSTAYAQRSARPIWVTAYYPGWIQNTLKPQDIDYKSLSCVVNFALIPKSDGTLDQADNGITDINASALIRLAHRAHRKALITVGGEGSGDAFYAAFQSHQQELIGNIVAYVQKYGYDGVDIDMETIEQRDAAYNIVQPASDARSAAYQGFIRALHAALKAKNRAYMLTAAAEAHDNTPGVFAPIAADFDQINVMTYNLSGSWNALTWYDSSLYGSKDSPNLLSCSGQLAKYVRGGVPKSKLGMGIEFAGLGWRGATGPKQPTKGVKTKYVPYSQIVTGYFDPAYYHWDTEAMSSYLSIPAKAGAPPMFLAYDDPKGAAAKIGYIRSNGMGGVIIWELGDGYTATAPPGKRDAFLKSIGNAAGVSSR